MQTKGIWPFKQTFYSICSAHQIPSKSCKNCNIGQWRYDAAHRAGLLLHIAAPGIWYWYHNRPSYKKKWLGSFINNSEGE